MVAFRQKTLLPLDDVLGWTNDQAEPMNRTIRDDTVKTCHHDDIESLKTHGMAFVAAYNFAKHLKPLRWRIPFHTLCDAWTKGSSTFKIDPHHLIQGPNI